MKLYNPTFKTEYGYDIKSVDEGFQGDEFYIYRTTHGISGIVRAQTWESAFEACHDEFCSVTPWDDIDEECQTDLIADGQCDGYGYNSSGQVIDIDYNEALDVLTWEMVKKYGLQIEETLILPSWTACPIVNDDWSGLDDDDDERLKDFLKHFDNHVNFDFGDDEPEFMTENELYRMGDNCLKVKVVYL